MVATSWPLPDGTLLLPRTVSSAADAPYLGESAIMYFLALPPADGVPIVRGGEISGLVVIALLVYFGVSLLGFMAVALRLRRMRGRSFECTAPALQLALMVAFTLGGIALLATGSFGYGLALFAAGRLFPRLRPSRGSTHELSPERRGLGPAIGGLG